MLVQELLENGARQWPDREALVCGDESASLMASLMPLPTGWPTRSRRMGPHEATG